MTLLKNTAVTKLSPNAKMTTITAAKKATPILKKPTNADSSLVKKPATLSAVVKGKTTSSSLKSSSVSEKSSTPVKSAGAVSAVKTPSPSLRKSTAALSTPSNVNKTSIIEKESKSNTTKSAIMKTPQRKIEETKKETPVRSVDKLSPVSKIKSKITSPLISKSTNAKIITTPTKIVSPVKAVSSPSKSNAVRVVNSLPSDKSKEMKPLKITSSNSIKSSPTSTKLAPVKITKAASNVAKLDDGIKIKPKLIMKKSPHSSPTALKNRSAVRPLPKLPISPISVPAEKTSEPKTPEIENRTHLCESVDINVDKCDDFDCDIPMTTKPTTNNDFDVVQAFKVAEQLIRIQTSDSNLETIVENCDTSTVNWDEVITPCVETIHPTYNTIGLNAKNQNDASTEISESLNYDHPCPVSITELDDIATVYDDSLKTVSDCEQDISINAESAQNSGLSESDITEVNEAETHIEDENLNTSSLSTPNESNVEWTIVIDEFSADLHKSENQYSISETLEEKENLPVVSNKTLYEDSAILTYADVLKRMPKVFANSTNIQSCKKEPKLNVNLEIKEYQMLKKVEALYSTNVFFNKIEKDIRRSDYENDDPDEAHFAVTRKKHHKKIKHSSKRYLKNIYQDFEYVDHTEVFITPVWKNIY